MRCKMLITISKKINMHSVITALGLCRYIYISTSKNKTIDINLTKYVYNLYEENNKTLMSKIKRTILCSCMGSLDISVLLNLIYRFNAIPIKIIASHLSVSIN